MATETEYSALQVCGRGQNWFELDTITWFPTLAALEAAIGEWKKRVTPRMVDATKFKIQITETESNKTTVMKTI